MKKTWHDEAWESKSRSVRRYLLFRNAERITGINRSKNHEGFLVMIRQTWRTGGTSCCLIGMMGQVHSMHLNLAAL